MDMQIKELIRQKREIEEKIKELRNEGYYIEGAQIGVERYPTERPDEWYLAVECRQVNCGDWARKPKNRKIILAHKVEDVIGAIPDLIRELQELYDKAVSNE